MLDWRGGALDGSDNCTVPRRSDLAGVLNHVPWRWLQSVELINGVLFGFLLIFVFRIYIRKLLIYVLCLAIWVLAIIEEVIVLQLKSLKKNHN